MRHRQRLTWVQRYPLIVSPSKGFRVELGTLVLFEANAGAGTRLQNKYIHKTNKHRQKLRCLFLLFPYCNQSVKDQYHTCFEQSWYFLGEPTQQELLTFWVEDSLRQIGVSGCRMINTFIKDTVHLTAELLAACAFTPKLQFANCESQTRGR